MISYRVKQKLDLRTGPSRTPGIHLSGILRPVAVQMGQIKTRDGNDDDESLSDLITRTPADCVGDNGTLMRIIIGFAWEEWVSKQIPGMIPHPGEYIKDGIICTPDGVECDDEGMLLHEMKATFTSSRKPVTDKLLWMWQAGCYLRAMSDYYHEHMTRVIFHPLFIKGDYTGIDPQYYPTLIVFEWEEVLSLWDMVVRHKHLAEPEISQS